MNQPNAVSSHFPRLANHISQRLPADVVRMVMCRSISTSKVGLGCTALAPHLLEDSSCLTLSHKNMLPSSPQEAAYESFGTSEHRLRGPQSLARHRIGMTAPEPAARSELIEAARLYGIAPTQSSRCWAARPTNCWRLKTARPTQKKLGVAPQV